MGKWYSSKSAWAWLSIWMLTTHDIARPLSNLPLKSFRRPNDARTVGIAQIRDIAQLSHLSFMSSQNPLRINKYRVARSLSRRLNDHCRHHLSIGDVLHVAFIDGFRAIAPHPFPQPGQAASLPVAHRGREDRDRGRDPLRRGGVAGLPRVTRPRVESLVRGRALPCAPASAWRRRWSRARRGPSAWAFPGPRRPYSFA